MSLNGGLGNPLHSIRLFPFWRDSNCGKSFLALDIAVHIATGQSWMGHKTRIGQVLYLACEGGKKSFAPRIEAISRAKSFLKEKRDSDNFLRLPLQVDLHGKQDA